MFHRKMHVIVPVAGEKPGPECLAYLGEVPLELYQCLGVENSTAIFGDEDQMHGEC
jgi:hypothetical protein